MNKPMTVGELMAELSRLPPDAEVQMSMKVVVKTSIGKNREGEEKWHNHDSYCFGKVYGVSSSIGGSTEVMISGS